MSGRYGLKHTSWLCITQGQNPYKQSVIYIRLILINKYRMHIKKLIILKSGLNFTYRRHL